MSLVAAPITTVAIRSTAYVWAVAPKEDSQSNGKADADCNCTGVIADSRNEIMKELHEYSYDGKEARS